MKLGISTSHLNLDVIVEDVSAEVKRELDIKNIEVQDYQIIHPNARRKLEEYSRTNPSNLVFDPYKIPNFISTLTIQHNNNYTTHIAQEMLENDNHQAEEITYIVSVDEQGNPIGNGEIRTLFGPHMLPRVASTNTDKNNRGKGLGTQRYKLMNLLSKVFYNKPLHSDNCIQPAAKNLWEQFVATKQAESYEEKGQQLYRFLK